MLETSAEEYLQTGKITLRQVHARANNYSPREKKNTTNWMNAWFIASQVRVTVCKFCRIVPFRACRWGPDVERFKFPQVSPESRSTLAEQSHWEFQESHPTYLRDFPGTGTRRCFEGHSVVVLGMRNRVTVVGGPRKG